MSLTYTPPGQLGSHGPDFSLLGVDGQTYSKGDFSEKKARVYMFICNHCPYVQAIEDRILQLASEMGDRAHFVAICSNDPTDYDEDSFENLKKRWQEKQYGFPYLFDEEQTVARAFGAVCTPDFFVYDQNNELYYRGRLDDSWKDPSQVEQQELKDALLELLADKPSPEEQIPSMGCSIKWKDEAQ